MSLVIPLAAAYWLELPGAASALFAIAVAVVVLMPTLTLPALGLVHEPEPERIERQQRLGWRGSGSCSATRRSCGSWSASCSSSSPSA
jgi:hypothetical protein